MNAGNVTVGVRVRIGLEPNIAIGPGKADLLQGIRDTGSIAAAARGMGMSYKRAWLLVETMNQCFRGPLVTAIKGGRHGGGAQLTRLGEQVLQRYRHMEQLAIAAIAQEIEALRQLLAVPSSNN